jgi:hypothetical protein
LAEPLPEESAVVDGNRVAIAAELMDEFFHLLAKIRRAAGEGRQIVTFALSFVRTKESLAKKGRRRLAEAERRVCARGEKNAPPVGGLDGFSPVSSRCSRLPGRFGCAMPDMASRWVMVCFIGV